MLLLRTAAVTAVISLASVAAGSEFSIGDFDAYIIRHGTIAPGVNQVGANGAEFLITEGGQKAALGTNSLNGLKMSQIGQLKIDRDDDYTRFLPTDGAYYAPYMNFWVTDGNGDYAVIANEPSNAEWAGTSEWDADWMTLSGKTATVYDFDGDFDGPTGPGLTFADFANFTIAAPDAAYIIAGNGVGSGAPRELNTYTAYGFNWVFGDTLSNYVSGDPGFIVSDPLATAAPVPEPLAAFGGASVLALIAMRRRRA